MILFNYTYFFVKFPKITTCTGYIEKNHIFFKNLIIHVPLFFTMKTSKYCDKGKKDQHKIQESNIQQYTHSKPNKQNRVHVIV